MCGFLTYVKSSSSQFPNFNLSKQILKKRGPDFDDELISENFYSYHSRLSIIDLDERSNQPFFSICNRYVILFNGEIYNYIELSHFLKQNGVSLRTSSDTEVLLNLYIYEGEKMLTKLRGMFSFFIWDLHLKKGFVARDPYGIKPLYYLYTDDSIIFSSQVKAIVAAKLNEIEINKEAITEFKLLGSITEDNTIFKEIRCFKAGYKMNINGFTITSYSSWADINTYISIRNTSALTTKNNKYILAKTHSCLLDSVRHHLISDVKLGLFLSSGIDSSTIASFLKETKKSNVIGITIVFENDKNDESEGALNLAEYFGIELYIKRVSKAEFYNDLDSIFESMDQPSIDGINTWYAAKAASECGIKVVLSGVGADELFQGYSYYRTYPKFAIILSKVLNFKLFNTIFSCITKIITFFSSNLKWRIISDWMKDLAGGWLVYRAFITPGEISSSQVDKNNLDNLIQDFRINNKLFSQNTLDTLTYLDNKYYLKNQLLRDSDWATMYHGVELRTPFVDYTLLQNIAEFRHLIPYFPKKSIMYSELKYRLPDYITNRKKTGFSIPVKKWLSDQFDINTKEQFSNFIISRYFQSLHLKS